MILQLLLRLLRLLLADALAAAALAAADKFCLRHLLCLFAAAAALLNGMEIGFTTTRSRSQSASLWLPPPLLLLLLLQRPLQRSGMNILFSSALSSAAAIPICDA